jgi:peptidoglycan/LPS O-acetylase OafA/YrhL
MTTINSQRRYEFDWLRIFAILIVFLYHSLRFFNLGDWHVKNMNTYVWVEIWNIFATRWMMPLFFIISGASLFYALGKSGGWKRFYTDKLLRLFIPVLIASITHGALQVYLERMSHGRFEGSFISFLPHYFSGVYTGIGLAGAGNFANVGMHLWYLLFLFIYSLLCYRLFVWFRTDGQQKLEGVTNFLSIPGIIYIGFTVPMVIMKVIIPSSILNVGNGGWGFLYYLWFLIAGFIVVSNKRLQQSILKQRWLSLMLGVILSFAQLYLVFGVSEPVLKGNVGAWASSLFSYFNAWTWTFAILAFAMKHLSIDRPILRPLNEGVLPFFILHQTVLLFFGYHIMGWKTNDVFKWVLVFIISFLIIVVLYWYLIRKLDFFRFLFGMKTSSSFYQLFQKKIFLIIIPLLWLGLSIYAGINQKSALVQDRFPMPLTYDQERDIVLNAGSITAQSSTGIQVVEDEKASIGRAIELSSGAVQSRKAKPNVYFDMEFTAQAGRYFAWIRGKCHTKGEMADSIWLQADNQINTRKGSVHLGNWNTFQPIGVYSWAGDVHIPYIVLLKHSGKHTIRVQPRQVPHRIDQIWLSCSQDRIPDSNQPVE